MITDRIGRHELLLPINHNLTQNLSYIRLFFKIKTQEFQFFFLLAVKKCHLSARVMACTVQLLRHDAYCPIKAEVKAVDSQSDLRILLSHSLTHLVARRRATTGSFHCLLSAISAAISLASNVPVSLLRMSM